MRPMRIIGHGIDVVDIARIAAMLRDHGPQFIARCFTDAERAYCESVGGAGRRAERYAVRFAAKEATFKALGTGWRSGISWRDAGIVHEPSGQPRLVVAGRCAEIARERGIAQWLVSLSHTPAAAMASVIAWGDGGAA